MNATLNIPLLTAFLCGNLHAAETAPIQAVAAERVSTRPGLVITTLGFGSCARQERPQPIWDAINAARCDAFVLCGDNIYADTADAAVFRGKYALLAAMPGFAKLRQTTPLFATWDDHDYGLNDGGAGFPGAAASQTEFCDFFEVPADSPLRSSPGVYDCVTFGPAGKRVQLILLDTRSFRSPLKKDPGNPKVNAPNTDAGATILGGEQWAWLERRLREPAEIRAVVSSISFISTEHGSEKWANFPQERARFLELLHRTQARGVVVVVILVDDMGYGDPGCYNPRSKIATPQIDRLAREGMRFTDAHAPGPLCHPSRYGLMTGRYPFRTDITRWPKEPLIEKDQ
jgi:alkaline phosphatase D